MITKPDILKMIKAVRRRSQGIPDRRLIHPRRDWAFVVLVTLLGAIGVISYSSYAYLRYDSLNSTIVAETSQVTRYDANAVAQVLERYAAKSAAFRTLTAKEQLAPVETSDTQPSATSTEALTSEEVVAEEEVPSVPDQLAAPEPAGTTEAGEAEAPVTEPPTLGF